MTVTFCGPAFWHQWAQADPLGRPPPQAATGTCRQPTARSCGVASKSHILLGLSPLCCLSAAWRCEQLSAVASSYLFGSDPPAPGGVALRPALCCRIVFSLDGGSLASLFVYSSLVSCAASWAAWRGGRLSLPPPRVSLVSLFVYSSLVSCAASWAAWRECRLHAGVAPRHERICPSSGFIGMRGPSAPAPSTLRWDVRYCVALPLWRHATPD